MLLAAFAFASALCTDKEVVVDVVVPVVQVEAIVEPEPEVVVIEPEPEPLIEPVVEEVKPVITNIVHGPAIKKYEDVIASLPPIAPAPPPPPTLPEVFMFDVLHRPHVYRTTLDDYKQRQMSAGDVLAYMWINDSPFTILQYATICTAYGEIYVTCNLDENGNILDINKPLDVYYSSPSLKQVITALAHDHAHRFPTTGMFSIDVINNLDDLNFLFGDTTSRENSYNVAYLL